MHRKCKLLNRLTLKGDQKNVECPCFRENQAVFTQTDALE